MKVFKMKSKLIALISLCVCKLTLAQNNIEHPVGEVDYVFLLLDKKDTTLINKLQSSGLTIAIKWQTPHVNKGNTGIPQLLKNKEFYSLPIQTGF